jgi:hypothetical protein
MAFTIVIAPSICRRLLMGALGDFAAKSRDGCNRGGRVRRRGFIRESDGAAIRRGAALLAISEGSSAQVRYPSTKLAASENRELRFRQG